MTIETLAQFAVRALPYPEAKWTSIGFIYHDNEVECARRIGLATHAMATRGDSWIDAGEVLRANYWAATAKRLPNERADWTPTEAGYECEVSEVSTECPFWLLQTPVAADCVRNNLENAEVLYAIARVMQIPVRDAVLHLHEYKFEACGHNWRALGVVDEMVSRVGAGAQVVRVSGSIVVLREL